MKKFQRRSHTFFLEPFLRLPNSRAARRARTMGLFSCQMENFCVLSACNPIKSFPELESLASAFVTNCPSVGART